MTDSWMQPVSNPLFVEAWARELSEKNHDKPTALGTKFRYSDALNCSRRMVFDAMGIEKTDPIDPAGIFVTTLGTWIHEQMQESIGRIFPQAKFEVVSGDELISGSADGDVTVSDGKMLLEIKSVGGFAFNKSIGVKQNGYKRGSPDGPRPSAIVQAGLNALHLGCDTVVVMYISRESISKGKGDTLGLSMFERFTAEWHIPFEVWHPMATAEMERIDLLNQAVDNDFIPQGDYFDDQEYEWVYPISPNDSRPRWVCSYCPHVTTCRAHEAGIDVRPAA